jgi:hypothetical protein
MSREYRDVLHAYENALNCLAFIVSEISKQEAKRDCLHCRSSFALRSVSFTANLIHALSAFVEIAAKLRQLLYDKLYAAQLVFHLGAIYLLSISFTYGIGTRYR